MMTEAMNAQSTADSLGKKRPTEHSLGNPLPSIETSLGDFLAADGAEAVLPTDVG
jgi:hypothetical protein